MPRLSDGGEGRCGDHRDARVNPQQAPDARLAMSGVESQFGFDEALLLAEGRGGAAEGRTSR